MYMTAFELILIIGLLAMIAWSVYRRF